MGVHYSHLNQAANCIYDMMQYEALTTLSFNDVFCILSYERDYYEQLSFSTISEDSLKIIRFIRLNASMDGKEFSTQQIREVLMMEEEYLKEMGTAFFYEQASWCSKSRMM